MNSSSVQPSPPSQLVTTRRRRIVLFFVVFGIVLAVAASAPWFLARWKEADARNLASKALKYLDERNYRAAMPLLVQAWQITPNDPGVLRGLGRACDAIPNAAPDAAVFWRRLLDTGKATVDDRISMAASLLKVSNPVSARKVMEAVPEDKRRNRHYAEVLAALLRSEGREKEASDTLREAWRAAPNDPACQLKLAMMNYDSPFDPIREAARKSIWEVARRGGEPGTEALKVITATPELSVSEVPEVRRLLDANKEIDPQTRLRILRGCLQKFPQFTEEFVAQEAPRLQSQKLEDRAEMYEWLARIGDDARIISDLTEPSDPPNAKSPRKLRPEVMRSRDLFLAYGDALIRANRWKDFRDILDQRELPISSTDAGLMRALCAKGLGEEDENIDRHLSLALDSASKSHQAGETARVAEVAERLDRPAIELEACQAIKADDSNRLLVQRRMLRLQQRLGNGDGMLRTIQSILASSPGLSGFADQSIYLKVVTGWDMESAVQELAASADTTDLRRLAAAMASYAEGDIENARSKLATIRGSELQDGPRAVLADSSRRPAPVRKATDSLRRFRLLQSCPMSNGF